MADAAANPHRDEPADDHGGDGEARSDGERESGLDAILEHEQASTTPAGDGLTDLQADALCAVARSTVIVLAGGVKSGKTTVLTAIYEQLNQQPFGTYLFGGSQTLYGFEKRGHGWREYSGMSAPMTERTGFTQPPWLHIVLRETPRDEPRRLLLADLSGEHFERLISGTSDPSSLPMLSRADHLAVVLDGRKLSVPSERVLERSRAEQLLQVLCRPGVLASSRVLSVIVTKLDRYLRDGPADDLDVLVERLQHVAGISHGLSIFRTAAQPRSPVFPMGHGVGALLAHWLSQPSYIPSPPAVQPPTDSAYARFGLGRAGDA